MHQATRTSCRTLLLLLIFALALSACSRSIGYGVVLWSDNEDALPSGTVVTIVSQSDIHDTYEIRSDTGPVETLARWRVRFHQTEEDAAADALAYADLAQVYARSTRNALPMRSDPGIAADNIVYRLREGEVIKIIGRGDEPANLSGLVSYWYRAQTATGVEGYVFGYELSLFNPQDPQAAFSDSGTADPLIQLLLTSVWRPVYYLDMISSGAYDLSLFREEYGLFPDPEQHRLELVTPSHSAEFEYEDIVKVGPRRYLAEGTNLQITFNMGNELSLQFVQDGNQYIIALQRVDGNISDYVETELERRETMYTDLIELGPAFSSGNYGQIILYEDRRFNWSGYERLVPAVIPRGLGTGGTVAVDLYLGPDLSDTYDGAISFVFDGNRQPVSFVYEIAPGGIRMVYVPRSEIDDHVVTGAGVSSITLFFSAVGS